VSRLASHTPADGSVIDFSLLVFGLGIAKRAHNARQLERAYEESFGGLIHAPILVATDAVAPRLLDVSLVHEPPEWLNTYEFEVPALKGGSVLMFAVQGQLPALEWEY